MTCEFPHMSVIAFEALCQTLFPQSHLFWQNHQLSHWFVSRVCPKEFLIAFFLLSHSIGRQMVLLHLHYWFHTSFALLLVRFVQEARFVANQFQIFVCHICIVRLRSQLFRYKCCHHNWHCWLRNYWLFTSINRDGLKPFVRFSPCET